MKIPKLKINFKSKKTWIALIIIFILIITIVPNLLFGKKGPNYETIKAEKGILSQTVDATGKIESSNNLSLHFDGMGIVGNVRVKEGDKVKSGQWLANLSLSQLNAAVSQAQAALDQKLAGSTNEQVNVSQKQVESARVALEKAEKSLEDVESLGEKNLSAKYSYALNILDDSYIKMYNAYVVVESIQKNYFTESDQDGLAVKNSLEYEIRRPKDQSKIYIDIAKNSNNRIDIDRAVSESVIALNKILNGLTIVRKSCDETAYKNKVTASEKTSLDTQKSYVSTAQISTSTLQNDISILKTQNNNNINTAQASIDSARANLDLQQANYESLIAKPRDIDIAYYQAALDQAIANRNKAIILAPIDGIVTKVNKKTGELISSAELMIEILSPHYEIKVDIPETDVVKIKLNDLVEITLDALGKDTKFEGKVLSIDPASTEIQGVVYYKVRVGFVDDNNDLFKSGMTTDVLINTERKENVVFIPSRAVLTRINSNDKYVRILKDGKIIENNVILGMKGDDGKIEIISGLEGGEEVILRTGK